VDGRGQDRLRGDHDRRRAVLPAQRHRAAARLRAGGRELLPDPRGDRGDRHPHRRPAPQLPRRVGQGRAQAARDRPYDVRGVRHRRLASATVKEHYSLGECLKAQINLISKVV